MKKIPVLVAQRKHYHIDLKQVAKKMGRCSSDSLKVLDSLIANDSLTAKTRMIDLRHCLDLDLPC